MQTFFRSGVLVLLSACFLLSGCASTGGTAGGQRMSREEIDIRLDLAEAYLNSGEVRRSLKELQLISDKAHDNPRYHFALGWTYLGLYEWDRAAESLEKAVKLQPDWGEAHNLLGMAYYGGEKLEKAEESFKTALSILTYLTPEYPANNLAKLYLEQERYDLAEHYATMAIDKNWRFDKAYLLLSDILVRKGKTREAVDWLRKGTEANLETPALPLQLAINLQRLGQIDEAKKWFRRVVEDHPKSEEAKVARDYLDIL